MSAPWVKNTLMASGVAIAWFFGWMIAIAALRPEYSHATKAVSELGALGAPYMLAWNVLGFLGTGLALTGFAWAYRKLLGQEAVGFQALAASGVLFCLTAIPITMGSDGDPDYASRWTQAHLAAVLLSPLPWLYAVSRIAVSFRRGKLSTLSVVSAVAIGGVLLATAARLAQLLPHAPGLLQRASFVPYLGWYTAAWLLLRRSAPFLATDEGRHKNDSSPS
jgi:hypothetical protein